MENDEDFDDDDYSAQPLTDIQLGFVRNGVNNLFLDKDWSNWDGGKVGGFPIWLDKSDIPDAKKLECKRCSEPMQFLLQIYCPLDDYEESAFHRCLYIFCCKKAFCNENGSVVCLRSQLPKDNSFYPGEDTQQVNKLHLCAVCGLNGSFSCSACLSNSVAARYCCKKHQQLDWKVHKKICGKESVDIDLDPSTIQNHKRKHAFAEYDICIDEEDLNVNENKDKNECSGKDDITKIDESTVVWEDAVTEGGEDEKADAALKQSDYEKALGNEESDPLYSKFLSRVRMGGDKQILRYYCGPRENHEEKKSSSDEDNKKCGDEMPLALSSSGYVSVDEIPPCEYCGAPRVFEFQVMPQLLHFLKVDQDTQLNKFKCLNSDQSDADLSPDSSIKDKSDIFVNKTNEDIDWGSIDVFTCSRSCKPPEDMPYISEFCWRQPPPVVSGHQLHMPTSES